MLKKSIVFTALAGLAFTVITPAPAYAKTCLNHKHTGSARAALQKFAKIAARAKWRFEVIKHGHPASIIWSLSDNNSMSCSKKIYGYKCWAKATPCSPSQSIKGRTRYKVMGRCLNVAGGVNANRTNVQIFDCNGTKSQQWTHISGKEFRNAMGRCLDVAGGVSANGTNVQIFDCNRTKAQLWTE